MLNPFENTAQYFPTPLQQFQYYDKYSRFDYGKSRRETWPETVDRAIQYLAELAPVFGPWLDTEGRQMILNTEALPSMRLLAMAGVPARRQNLSIFSCSYVVIDDPQAWVEMLIISMAGCGVGFSVERKYIDKLPRVARLQRDTLPESFWDMPRRASDIHTVEDSSEGWAEALRIGFEHWFSGFDIAFDYSQIRPAGAPLLTKGGRASGPEPLRNMLNTIRDIILARAGSRLRTIDAHDISCVVGEAAVQGGMRRTAMISLSDPDDQLMINAKTGTYPSYRWNANNSSAWPYTGVTDAQILKHFVEMDEGKNGERGIFSRQAAWKTMPARRKEQWMRDETERNAVFCAGTNPCAEIILRPNGLCNLSIAVARAGDRPQDLARKVKAAAIFGTIQSTATHFPGLRPRWTENAKAERLLGVDITGQLDCGLLKDSPRDTEPNFLARLRDIAVTENHAAAQMLGINPSLAVTCVKPSGNSSTLLDCAPGLHARHSRYYVRNVRVSAHSPVYKVLRAAGAPLNPENGQMADNATTWVCAFPCKAPDGALVKADVTALDQLAIWKANKLNWTEHNPSITVTYKPDELVSIVKWVADNREIVGGISFLPTFDANYEQMPYVEITKSEYEQRLAAFPQIDWSKITEYEDRDLTNAAQELACVGGACLI